MNLSLFELYASKSRSHAAISDYDLLLSRTQKEPKIADLSTNQLIFEQKASIATQSDSNDYKDITAKAAHVNSYEGSEDEFSRPSESIPEIETQALATFLNGQAASGETLSSNIRATWQGKNLSNLGNNDINAYAFVIDSDVLTTTNDLNLNQALSKSLVIGKSSFADVAGHGSDTEDEFNPPSESIPEIETQALATFLNGRAASGETLPWGIRATWQGKDLTNLGNIGINTYAFVIDSGVLATTNDLNLNQAWSKSWVIGESPFADGAGHGTHVAGTIGALVNGRGVVGVAPGASIVSLKVFSNNGQTTQSNVISAVEYAAAIITENNLDLSKVVINLSLGGPFSPALSTAVLNAANLGIRFTVAAGNIGADADATTPSNTGTHPNVFTVSAVDNNYVMPSWSNWDQVTAADPVDSVDVAAPGVNILSYSKFGLLTNLSGTSMAAPHVAGALLIGGGVQVGNLVTPFTPGTADPFALAASSNGGNSNIPEAPSNQYLWGSLASETIIGGNGNENITGVLASGTTEPSLGQGQIDVLIGGLGADVFLLGDSRGVFYDDRNVNSPGISDYALVQDFTTGVDKLQLQSGNYFTTVSGGNTSIYWDANANGRFETLLSSNDELIAVINNWTVASSDIVWI